MVLARWAFSNYTWPDGSGEDSQRFSMGVNYAWGRRDAPPPPRVYIDTIVLESNGAIHEPDASVSVVLRTRKAQ